MTTPSDATSTFTRMLHAIDGRDWQGVRDAFADRVAIDYSSLFGAPPEVFDADEHVGRWRAFGGAFDVTQHITGPFVTAGTSAVVANTHVRAFHRVKGARGGDIWLVAGHYEIRLIQPANVWQIAAITLKVLYQDGNLELPDIAKARAPVPIPVRRS